MTTYLPSNNLLLVEDDPAMVALVEFALQAVDVQVFSVPSLKEARALLAHKTVQGILLDLGLPDGDGRDLLDEFSGGPLSIVVLTAQSDAVTVDDCLARGAVDFVHKPFDEVRLRASVTSALRQTHQAVSLQELEIQEGAARGLARLIGSSTAMVDVCKLLGRAGRTAITVLLTGESGTGKEVAARALHEESPRSSKMFVPINCGAIPANLIESELFGHERGSFTGAHATHRGCFEQAEGGTLFLDEVGDLPLEMQVKLLRVLQEQEVMRVGGSAPIPVDVRVIAATNRDLQKDMQDGVFRPDLYYRLAVFPVHMPPLRDRPEDVSVLAQTMLHQLARRHGRKTLTLAPETKAALRCHSWPGNVRELKNTLERGVLLEDGQVLHPAALQLSSSSGLQPHQADGANDVFQVPQTRDDLLPLDTVERIWLRRALDLCDWNIREVSRRLGVGRATIARRIDLYGWEAPGVAESSAADN